MEKLRIASKKADLPPPFGPTKTVKGRRDIEVSWWIKKFLILISFRNILFSFASVPNPNGNAGKDSLCSHQLKTRHPLTQPIPKA